MLIIIWSDTSSGIAIIYSLAHNKHNPVENVKHFAESYTAMGGTTEPDHAS